MKAEALKQRWGSLIAVVAGIGMTWSAAAAAVTLYSTQFEPGEGYNTGQELAGQKGWTSSGSGGNGFVNEYIEGLGYHAYVGYFPPDSGDTWLDVYRPVSYTPTNRPVVTFSTDFAIIDSSETNGYYDEFRWSVYNKAGYRLFSLVFDNRDLSLWRLQDDDQFHSTDWGFEDNGLYTLEIKMNFASNVWSAWLTGVQRDMVVTNAPITTTNAELSLGDVDAVWVLGDAAHPGDNYMIFDNYTLTADVLPEFIPSVELPVAAGDGQQLVRINGRDDEQYAIEASGDLLYWTALKTNTVSGGYFDYLDTAAAGKPVRFYRARWIP